MSLLELQQRVLQAVLADESTSPAELFSGGTVDAADRLAVYRQGYRVRLRDSLAVEFPGLSRMMGGRFQSMLESYIDAHPSTHYNIRWHGAGLAAFLAYGLPWRSSPELADMANLDWAISTAFDAADESAMIAAELAELPSVAWANLRLCAKENLQILSVHHNVDAFRRAADQHDKRPRLRRHKRVRHFLVWRQMFNVRYRHLRADELSALSGSMQGESFAELCERQCAFHQPIAALPRMLGQLQQWLAEGLIRASSS
jgi:hypothetical protein